MKQRSKRLLSVLLTLVMLLGMIPGMTLDARADGDVAQIGSTGYQTLQAAFYDENRQSGDTIVLLKDVTENVDAVVGFDYVFDSSQQEYNYTNKTATLDLAGHGITAKSKDSVIKLTQGVLTVTDSTVMDQDTKNDITHYYYIDAASGLAIIDDTQETPAYQNAATKGSFTGGYITGGNAENGGGVYVTGASLNMLAGTIIGNTATSGGGAYVTGDVTLGSKAVVCYNTATEDGGGVCKGEGVVTLDGVNIHHNASRNGGGVSVRQGGELFIRNGTAIAQNTAKKAGETGGKGGGIYAENVNYLLLDDSTITENTADEVGGVYLGQCDSFTPKGKAIIFGNKNTADVASNLYITATEEDGSSEVSAQKVRAIQAQYQYQSDWTNYVTLTSGSKIGVALSTGTGKFTLIAAVPENAKAEDLLPYFISDIDSYQVAVTRTDEAKELWLSPLPVAEVWSATENGGYNEKLREYTTLQAALDAAQSGQTVKLLKDVTTSVTLGTMDDTTGKSVTLDLNGNSVTGSEIYAITVWIGSLTLTDSRSGGRISNPSGGAVSVRGGATFIMKGGSLCNNKPTSSYGGAGVVNLEQRVVQGAVQSGKFQMEGGAIENNESSANTGCGVYMSPGSTFTMTGGRISNNRGNNSVGVYAGGDSHFTMTGGEISNNVASGHSTGVRVESPNVTFGGTAKVIGNKRSDDTTENVFMLSERVMVSTATPFEDGASVGITLGTQDGKGVFTKDIADDDARNAAKLYFSSDNPKYRVLPTVAADNAANQLKLDVVVYAKLENLSIANSTEGTRDGSGDESTYPQVGDALKAVATDNSETHLPATPVTYQWYRADSKDGTYTAIQDAMGETYTATAADVDKYLKVVVTQSKDENDEDLARPITMQAVIGPVALRPAPTPFQETHPTYPTSNDGQIAKNKVEGEDVANFENLYYSADNGNNWTKVQTDGKTAADLPAGTYLFQYRDSDSTEGKHAESKIATVILTPTNDLLWLKLTSTNDKKANEVGAIVKAETNLDKSLPAGTTLSYQWYRVKENADGTVTKTTLEEETNPTYTIVEADGGCKVLAEVTWTYPTEQKKSLSTPTPIILSETPTTYSVSGKVEKPNTNDDNASTSGVPNATVELRQGNTVIATATTNNEGNYSFATTVPNGEYNIVVTTANGKTTKTERVTVNGANASVNVLLPYYNVSSLIVVQGNTPAVVIGSLDGLAKTESAGISDGQSIEVKLTVEGKEDLTEVSDTSGWTAERLAEKADQTKVKQKATETTGADTVVEFIDMSILKSTTANSNTTTEQIRDTRNNVLKIRIPYMTEGRYQFGIYRKHVDDSNHETTIAFQNNSTKGDGTFEVGKGYLDVYATKFSTYAIGYTTTPPNNNNNNNNNNNSNNNYTGGGGSDSDSSYPVTVGQTANGTVKADRSTASAGTRVTLTVTPDNGCKVDSVTVTDKNGKTVPVTRNSDGTYRFNMPESAVTVNVTFAKKFADPAGTGVADWLNTDDHILYIRGYNEKGVSTVRPDNNITRAEAAMMFYRLLKNQDVTVTKTFTDVSEGQWYAQPIGVLASLGIVGGYGDGTFLPNRTITRAEFAKIATRFAIATGGKAQFSDVPEGHWAGGFIATAADYGWIGGYEDGTYRPDGFMTRAAAAKIINYMLGRSADREYVLSNRENLVKYTDLTDPGVWYYFEIVEASVAHDFTVTDGTEKWK